MELEKLFGHGGPAEKEERRRDRGQPRASHIVPEQKNFSRGCGSAGNFIPFQNQLQRPVTIQVFSNLSRTISKHVFYALPL